MQYQSKTDQEIAQTYLKLLIPSILRGENSFVFWLPGQGKSYFLDYILNHRSLLKSHLGLLSSRLLLVPVLCNATLTAKAEDILLALKPKEFPDITSWINSEITQGKEFLFIVNNLENLPHSEVTELLRKLGQLRSLNKSRVHCLIFSINRPLLESLVIHTPLIASLSENIIEMPLIQESLLERSLKEIARKNNVFLSSKHLQEIVTQTGGIYHLSQELIRDHGRNQLIDLRFKSTWYRMPPLYQQVIKKYVLHQPIAGENERTAYKYLKKTGVLNLKIFQEKYHLIENHPEKLISKVLSPTELRIWEYLNKNRGQVILKEAIGDILWGNDLEAKYSTWAIDQTMSRFRKKIESAGMEPEFLQTIRGQGYRWTGITPSLSRLRFEII